MLLGSAPPAPCARLRRRRARRACGCVASAGAAPRHCYRLRVAYDGTAYAGYQLQPAARGESVQGALEAALSRVLSEPRAALGLAAAARTDAGVHASGQVCSFSAARPAPRGAAELARSLNGLLPDDVRVLHCADAPPGFSARFAAVGKTYAYRLDNAAVADPLQRRVAAHVFAPLDVEAMRDAAARFLGTHNFSPFANVATVERDPVRFVHRCDVLLTAPDQLCIQVEGSGFLYRQVRNMVGALCLVGLGKAPPEAVSEALARCARVPRLKSAPAHGLCLARVFYADEADTPEPLLAAARRADAQHAAGERPAPAAPYAPGTPRSAAAASPARGRDDAVKPNASGNNDADEQEPPGLLVDCPRLHPTAPRWRRRLFYALHTRSHHALLVAVIVACACVNVSGLLVLLFTRDATGGARRAAHRASAALRWTTVALLLALLCEYLLRAAVVGPLRFLSQPIHALDGALTAALLAVKLSVPSRRLQSAIGLLIVVRLLRVVRLLTRINVLAHAEERKAYEHAEALAERVTALEARLRAAERGDAPVDAAVLRDAARCCAAAAAADGH